jgi:HAD superfamily phosphoserine phosphatase-like hydrolase
VEANKENAINGQQAAEFSKFCGYYCNTRKICPPTGGDMIDNFPLIVLLAAQRSHKAPIVDWSLPQMMRNASIGLAVFDLDGTLLRGPTVCEILAAPLGRLERMRQLEACTTETELTAAREEMASWYNGILIAQLTAALEPATWAPGTLEGIQWLQAQGVAVAIASITWEFAVAWFARQLDIPYYLGTTLQPNGEIQHVWPRDKASWLRRLAKDLGIPARNIAAVGDSAGDVELLLEASHAFYVGANLPDRLAHAVHLPHADIVTVASRILDAFGRLPSASPSVCSPGGSNP